MATLKQSNGTNISTTLSDKTTRRIVQVGHATVTTPGTSGFDVVTLGASHDAAYLAATPSAPVKLGVDDILFKPLQFPEA